MKELDASENSTIRPTFLLSVQTIDEVKASIIGYVDCVKYKDVM